MHKTSLTESFRNTLNRLDSIVMEAKPENLGQGMLDKLFRRYESRDINDNTLPRKFNNGLEVADYIYQHVGPDFLTWVAKQYNQDQRFFLHDLPEWKNVLDQFRTVLKDKRVQIERDINRYQNIDTLRQSLTQAGGAQQEMGSKFYERVITKLEPFVESGQASWIYRGKDYSIYYPKTWAASQAVASACPHKTSVCVAASETHYKRYIAGGILMYTIGQDDVYLDYIKTKPRGAKSEFANSVNNHSYDLKWQLEKFPELRSVIKKAITKDTDTELKWIIDPPTDAELQQIFLKFRNFKDGQSFAIDVEDGRVRAVSRGEVAEAWIKSGGKRNKKSTIESFYTTWNEDQINTIYVGLGIGTKDFKVFTNDGFAGSILPREFQKIASDAEDYDGTVEWEHGIISAYADEVIGVHLPG